MHQPLYLTLTSNGKLSVIQNLFSMFTFSFFLSSTSKQCYRGDVERERALLSKNDP